MFCGLTWKPGFRDLRYNSALEKGPHAALLEGRLLFAPPPDWEAVTAALPVLDPRLAAARAAVFAALEGRTPVAAFHVDTTGDLKFANKEGHPCLGLVTESARACSYTTGVT